jgi:hypothetical protein
MAATRVMKQRLILYFSMLLTDRTDDRDILGPRSGEAANEFSSLENSTA